MHDRSASRDESDHSVTAGDEPATLQARIEAADDDDPGGTRAPSATVAADPTITSAVALFRHLDVSGRFHRDSPLGRIYHRGMISFRENVEMNSLHISVDGNRVKAHVDRVSPLTVRSDGGSGYSLRRALAHNLAGMAEDLVWLLRGRQGDHRSELDCEWITSSGPDEPRLLDPKRSAWSVQLEARVDGTLDEARLRTALDEAVGPRTSAHDLLEVVDCDDDDALDAARARLQSTPVALTQSPPLRVYLARHRAGDVLMLNLNHAASDGFGALQVLHRIAAAYAGHAGPAPSIDFLAARDLPVRPSSGSVPTVVRLQRRAVERLRDILAGPALLAADQPGEDVGYGYHLVGLSAQETRHVIEATDAHASTNVLMAALHLATSDWNRQHGTPSRRIGVLVQADLRPERWRQETVGNFSVTARMSTSRRERSGPASALKAITVQADRNTRTRTGTALIPALERAGLLALWAKQSTVVLQPLTTNRLIDTTVLCNLGCVKESPWFGSDLGEPLALWFSTPARAPLSLCLGAVTVAGRLHLTFRYPHRLFGPDAAHRFADCYLRHLRAVADSRS